MSILINLIVFIIVLSIIVFIHELGHFFWAKKSGVYCYEFSLGFGPKLFSFRRKNDETLYALRLIPVGGFVAMAGEEADDDESDTGESGDEIVAEDIAEDEEDSEFDDLDDLDDADFEEDMDEEGEE